jgi:hypothetical protein
MSHFVVDVEADNQTPLTGSLIQIGAVLVDKQGKFNQTFFGEMYPINDQYSEEALASFGMTREQTKQIVFGPDKIMPQFYDWIYETNYRGRPVLWSDNILFDGGWLSTYFNYFCGKNPFGFSGRRIGDLICGAEKDTFYKWKHLRDTKHTHNPVDDAAGNAEALYKAVHEYNINIKL